MKNKIIYAEFASAVGIFWFALIIIKYNLANIHSTQYYFISALLIIISSIQFIATNNNLVILRIIVGWIVGIIWTWVSFSLLNSIGYIPILAIGSLNIYASILLANQISVDWSEFHKE